MDPQEPTIPDPSDPRTGDRTVIEPRNPDQPEEYDAYDEADAESFPASDPPAPSEPGV